MARTVSFDGAGVQVLTLVYGRDAAGRVLMLERAAHKKFLPGWFVGVGGKVEAGENVFDAAAREFEEETGMRAVEMRLRGSYTFMTETPSNRCGVIYMFECAVEGDFVAEVADGTLHWLTRDEIALHPMVMPDHKVWMGEIFANDTHFACVGSWKPPVDGTLNVGEEWADSRGYFEGLEVRG